MADAEPPAMRPVQPPAGLQLLWIWLGLGVQSFGGGTATLFLIRRAVVERHGWLFEAEFTRDWALCQAAPGINLICLTVLVGYRVRGALGIVVAMIGLLLPSVTITALLTGMYASIRDLDMVQSALRGVVPATAGLGLLLSVQMLRPPLTDSCREGRASLILTIALVIATALLVGVARMPVIVALLGAGMIAAIAGWRRARLRPAEPQP
ncbi:MAG TPA: chromate transporter [Roseiflexaceae bacterium]|nr:chromate transporter [Roseiflexaceae bacterium]